MKSHRRISIKSMKSDVISVNISSNFLIYLPCSLSSLSLFLHNFRNFISSRCYILQINYRKYEIYLVVI